MGKTQNILSSNHRYNKTFSFRKSFNSDISSTFTFYVRELNLVSKCRQMNKLYREIIKDRGK